MQGINDCRNHGFKNIMGRHCVGWDDMSAREEIYNLPELLPVRVSHFIHQLYQNYLSIGSVDAEFRNTLFKIAAHAKKTISSTQNAKEKNKYGALLSAIDWLIDKKAMLPYDEIFKTYPHPTEIDDNSISQESLDKYKRLNLKRNVSLLKTVRNHAENSLAIYVTGLNHLLSTDDEAAESHTQNELEKFDDHKNSYAILSMRL